MAPAHDTSVLIVGAGPTGLALATRLLRLGVRPIVIDKLPAGLNTSRAAVIHAHTLETLEQIGVSERLANKGLKVAKFSLRDRDRVLVRLQFATLPSRYNFLLMLPQDMTEKILAEGLAEAGGTVRWGCALESLVETPEGVQATLVSSQGRQTVSAAYVVGADGMHSLVRQTAGIGFTGASYEESFILADVEMEWDQARDEVMLYFSPAGLVVVAPLPTGAFRIVATLDNAPEHPGMADLQALLDARGPTHGVGQVSQVHWSSRFRLHHRIADHYRRRRLIIMGDAAHVHSPAGGQGMNTGLVDACVLGRILSDVVSGRRDPNYLDQYETLRRPAAEQVLQIAGRLTHMAIMKSPRERMLRNFALGTFGLLPMVRRRLVMDLSGLSRRAAAQLPEAPEVLEPVGAHGL